MVTPNLLIFEASVVMVRGAERPDRALSTARLITRCALHLSDLRQVTYDPRRGTPAPALTIARLNTQLAAELPVELRHVAQLV